MGSRRQGQRKKSDTPSIPDSGPWIMEMAIKAGVCLLLMCGAIAPSYTSFDTPQYLRGESEV